MQSAAIACQALDTNVRLAGQQGMNYNNNSAYSQYCNTHTQSMPNSGGGGGGGGGSPSGMSPQSQMATEQAAKAAAAAQQAKEEAEALKKAKAGFEGLDDNQPGGFNVGNSNASQSGYMGNGEVNPNIAKIKGSGGQQGTVANNTGGQIPGQGGDSAGAKLGGGRGGSPGAPGYTTDVLNGFKGASALNTAGGSTEAKEEEGGFTGYGNGRTPAEETVDLRQYLPGGRRDPGAKLGGGFRPLSAQIHGPHVNVWQRITMRFLEKCRLGQLIDCR
jgi:hypothetical protein